MKDASRPNRRKGEELTGASGAPGIDAASESVSSSAAAGFVFEYHDEVLRRRAAESAENFLSDLAATLDAREIAEAEGDRRRAELAAKEVARRLAAFEALRSALLEIGNLEKGGG
jgi:hypothetical protein